MKRYMVLLLCFVFLLAGCGPKEQTAATLPESIPDTFPATLPEAGADAEPETTTPAEPAESELFAVSVPAVTERYTLEDGTELFSYTAQHMQLIHPDEDIADRVILNFLNRVDATREDAESTLQAAQMDYQSKAQWYPYFYQVIYSPTRIDYDVLSLFGTQNCYNGGIHGSLSCVSANYDLTNGEVLTLGSIMHQDATKEDFISIIIHKLAENEDDYELFSNYEDGVRSRLGGDENLYEDFFFTQTGLSFFFSPYEIAPYASGVITVEIPYNELTGLIYDGYFPAERESIQGTMRTGSFMETDMEQFSSMAEVTLSSGQEVLVAYPEGTVQDIRITIPGDGMNLPEYTVFAAYEMSDRNAVVISLAPVDVEGITVSYTTGTETQTIPLAE